MIIDPIEAQCLSGVLLMDQRDPLPLDREPRSPSEAARRRRANKLAEHHVQVRRVAGCEDPHNHHARKSSPCRLCEYRHIRPAAGPANCGRQRGGGLGRLISTFKPGCRYRRCRWNTSPPAIEEVLGYLSGDDLSHRPPRPGPPGRRLQSRCGYRACRARPDAGSPMFAGREHRRVSCCGQPAADREEARHDMAR